MNKFKFKNGKEIDLTQIKIESEKIDLISISHRYSQDIFREFTEEVARYMIPSPSTKIEESEAFIDSSINGMKEGHELVVTIVSKSGDFLGCAGLHGRGKCNTPEFGVWLKKTAQGSGFGRAAIHELWSWACETIDFEYAIYPVDKANEPSKRIPESLGGVVFKKAKVPRNSGGFLNEIIYRISA